jgi:hypothetical protein
MKGRKNLPGPKKEGKLQLGPNKEFSLISSLFSDFHFHFCFLFFPFLIFKFENMNFNFFEFDKYLNF